MQLGRAVGGAPQLLLVWQGIGLQVNRIVLLVGLHVQVGCGQTLLVG